MTEKSIKIIAGSAIVGVCFITGLFFANVYQPAEKTMQIYSSALKDFANGEYQNSYYLFSKVGYLSKLKPYAVYHQAECAKELGDKNSELKQYSFLFNVYKNNKLSLRAKYLKAQKILDENPIEAKKYFEQIINKAPNSDYAIASEYYLGILLLNKYKNQQVFPLSVKNEIETSFRHYLQKAPQGRHALNAVANWLALDKEILSDDYLLMAKTCYLFEDYEHAKSLLANADLSNSWVLDIKNSYALKNYSRVKQLTNYGLQNYTDYVSENDIHSVIDLYIALSRSKKHDIDYLYEISSPKGKDYIWSLKCDATQAKYQAACYQQLYLNYPNSEYGGNALANLFFSKISERDYISAEKIGKDYLNKFVDGRSVPRVMFWLGKIAERNNKHEEYMEYYKGIIANYPDNYYAYRAYVAMKHYKTPVLNASITPQPVEYPYKNVSKEDVIFKLAQLHDYGMLELIIDDEFIKSWIYYQKGDYSHSMLVARDAMEKVMPRPERNDLRWRLVYPIDYYDEIKQHAGSNDPTLMMALIREESYFNPNAQSGVGARGLMQLMPATAREISAQHGFGMTSLDDLFKPEFNIKLGNTYYSQLRNALGGMDISAIAAYNGGIGSVGRWKQSVIYNDTDEFIEQIPYAETKNYVKKVFRSYWNYLRIYVNK